MKFSARFISLSVVCLAMSAMLVSTAFAQTDEQVGVWKLNVAKSKYSVGALPKSGTTTIEAAGMGTKVSVDQQLADGTMRQWSFTSSYDGKDSTITGNNPDADSVARRRVNPITIQTVATKNGKVTTTQRSAVSKDGLSRIVTTTGTNAAGQKVNNMAFYDKQ
jgi:hypothetical protein